MLMKANTHHDLAEQKIFDIRSGAEIKGLTHIGGIVLDRIKALDELYKAAKEGKGQTITGLSTLYMDLDRRIYGLNRSDLIILAASNTCYVPAAGRLRIADTAIPVNTRETPEWGSSVKPKYFFTVSGAWVTAAPKYAPLYLPTARAMM